LGRADRPRVMLKTTLDNVIAFQQDPDYYSQKGTYYHRKNNLNKAVLYFRKAVELEPENPLHHYNLACVLSKAGQLEEANRIFYYIVQKLDPDFTECYFLMAINYGFMDDLRLARQYLNKYLQESPEGEMADEARDLIYALEEEEQCFESHREQLTCQDNEALEEAISSLSDHQLRRRFQEREFRKILHKGLYQGSDHLKEMILRLCGRMRTVEARRYLAEYVANPWVKERLRQIALLELKNISPDGGFRIYKDGNFVEINLEAYPLQAPVWKEEWQAVLDCTTENMRKNAYYREEFFEDVRAIWLDYINHVYPDVPRIVKKEAWSAGLEYSLARFHFLDLTQKELARQYGVSAASVSAKFQEINRVLQIDQKAYRNMLAFLAHQSREPY